MKCQECNDECDLDVLYQNLDTKKIWCGGCLKDWLLKNNTVPGVQMFTFAF